METKTPLTSKWYKISSGSSQLQALRSSNGHSIVAFALPAYSTLGRPVLNKPHFFYLGSSKSNPRFHTDRRLAYNSHQRLIEKRKAFHLNNSRK